MSSIRSTLIRACFSNIQRELVQLEDWLNRDFTSPPDNVASTSQSGTDSTIIFQAIQQLSKQLDSQQHTLHHIIDRIDVLEETRNIHINEKEENNLWLDTEGVELQNEIVDNEYEAVINVNKTEEVSVTESKSAAQEPVVPIASVDPVASVAPVDPVAPVVTVVEPVASVEPVAEETVAAEPEQEEGEEEEEDGLEEVEYNGTTYYRDSNLVMYQLNEDGELTDAVGVWKEKTQTIKFYKK